MVWSERRYSIREFVLKGVEVCLGFTCFQLKQRILLTGFLNNGISDCPHTRKFCNGRITKQDSLVVQVYQMEQ